MKQILENYKSNIPIFLLLVYSLGYVYLNRFYSQFNISIENYISLTDILFLVINKVIYTILLYLIIEAGLIFISQFSLNMLARIHYIKNNKDEILEKKVNEFINKHHNETSLVILLIVSIGYVYFGEEILEIAAILFSLFFIKLLFVIKKNQKPDEQSQMFYDLSFIILLPIFLICFGIWGYSESKTIKLNSAIQKELPRVEFSCNGKVYSTKNLNFIYIGETSSSLFIYDKIKRNSIIFNKTNISELKVEDPDVRTEERQLDFEKDFIQFKEKLKTNIDTSKN